MLDVVHRVGFFLPADGEHHTFVTRQIPDFRFNTLVMPRRHLEDLLRSEHHAPRFTWQHSLNLRDGVLQSCIARVFDGLDDDTHDALRADEAARRLVLRLAELCEGNKPDWHDDASVFDRRTLLGLVAFIDEHLREAPTQAELGSRMGLSPSHFAKKFRQSTGLSLHRFLQRRRIQRSLELMRTDASDSLAGVALDLGFSSQSHFTRLFSKLTGMTPAKYRRQVRPVVG